MNSKLNVSIALCTYNGERYLQEQLDSYCQQTQLPHELVICDDGSTDKTLEIIEAFKPPFPKKIFHSKRAGVAKNFERCIGLCQGDIIFTSDQDDVWLPKKIETLLAPLQDNEEIQATFCDALLVNADLSPKNETFWASNGFTDHEKLRIKKGDPLSVFIKHNVAAGTTMAFRKSASAYYLPIGGSWIHDYWVATILSCLGSIRAVNEPLVLYRQHPTQALGAPDSAQYMNRASAALLSSRKDIDVSLNQLEEIIQHLRISANQLLTEKIALFEKKKKFYSRRKALSASKIARIVPILRGLLLGEYFAFAGGFRSAAKDLLRR